MSHPLETLLEILCCPKCHNEKLKWELSNNFGPLAKSKRLTCSSCNQIAFLRDGILDFIGEEPSQQEAITPFQRLMQFPPLASVYNRYWRPLGFFIASSTSIHAFSTRLMELLNPGRHHYILDLACGPGLFTCPISDKTYGWVIGFDLSKPMLIQARRLLASRGISNVILVRGSAFRLPFRNQVFDAILCTGALHLFDRPDLALKEVSRTLSRDGRFICQTTLKPRHATGIATFLDRIIRFGFFRSAGEIHQQLGNLGFIVEHEWSRRIIYLFRARKV